MLRPRQHGFSSSPLPDVPVLAARIALVLACDGGRATALAAAWTEAFSVDPGAGAPWRGVYRCGDMLRCDMAAAGLTMALPPLVFVIRGLDDPDNAGTGATGPASGRACPRHAFLMTRHRPTQPLLCV